MWDRRRWNRGLSGGLELPLLKGWFYGKGLENSCL